MTPEGFSLWASAIFRHALIPFAGLAVLAYSLLTKTLDPTRMGLVIGLLTGGIFSSIPKPTRGSGSDGLDFVPSSDGHTNKSTK